MEKNRNEYRGALLWMKNVSQELDPDTFKQLEKFRRVQGQVRGSKVKFDRHKLACLQKIDLLAAARCNMFSHGLIVYQDSLAVFWQRTSNALTTVSDAYKGNHIITKRIKRMLLTLLFLFKLKDISHTNSLSSKN